MLGILTKLYGEDAQATYQQIVAIIDQFREKIPTQADSGFSQADCMFITYGDSIRGGDPGDLINPLQSLGKFARRFLSKSFNSIHILPFYPYHSDRGFSISDFFAVNPAMGDWSDVERLSQDFKLMFDFVQNHMSCKSDWYIKYASGDPEFTNFFMGYSDAYRPSDYPDITRPRPGDPVLGKREIAEDLQLPMPAGVEWLWRTFLNDQIDLNYKNPKVLVKMLEVLLHYVSRGCSLIRLDAVAYIWKEARTTCIHLPETHAIIKLMRMVLEEVAPHVRIISETNVPHADNISYFGNGHDEAHLVYNFALPPLTLLSFITGNATDLSRWAKALKTPSETTTFFNFLDSHDGVGLRPLNGLIGSPEEEIKAKNLMVQQVERNRGRVNMATNPDGTQSPYELNTTWWSALYNSKEDEATNIARYIASRAVALCLAGIPGIYIHGLLGSANDLDGVEKTDHNRDISRRNLHYDELKTDLSSGPKTSRIFAEFTKLLKIRREQTAFHPNAAQELLQLDERVFAVKRIGTDDTILSLINVSDKHVQLALPLSGHDLVADAAVADEVHLAAYQVMWIQQTA